MSGVVAIHPYSFDAPTNPYVTVDKFRVDFPAFADEATYSEPRVQSFLDLAGLMAVPGVWMGMTVMAQELLTAHFLTLQQYAMQRAAAGGPGGAVPGMAVGLMSSKSVSKVSVGYDYASSQMEGWGPFNLTVYGQQYAFFAQMAGTGGFEVLGVGLGSILYTQAWTWGRNASLVWGGVVTS
jgi:hypothetical protein